MCHRFNRATAETNTLTGIGTIKKKRWLCHLIFIHKHSQTPRAQAEGSSCGQRLDGAEGGHDVCVCLFSGDSRRCMRKEAY